MCFTYMISFIYHNNIGFVTCTISFIYHINTVQQVLLFPMMRHTEEYNSSPGYCQRGYPQQKVEVRLDLEEVWWLKDWEM